MVRKKKSKKKIYIIIFSLLAIFVLAKTFCGNSDDEIIITTEKVQRRTITQVVFATGKINPEYKVIITPEVTGEIVALPVKEGDFVKKGDVLIKLKPDTYTAQMERARASLKSSISQLKMTKSQLDLAKIKYNRKKELFDQEMINKQEMDQIESEVKSSKAQYESQAAIVSQSEASLRETKEQLSKTTILSPMDGTISQLNVELGEKVLGSGFSQGTNIMTVADLSRMEAKVEVGENDVVLLTEGDKAIVELDAINNKKFLGTVSQIANSAKTTGAGSSQEVVNFEVKIILNDFDKRIRPGMSCNTDIQTETKENVLCVPIQSVTARKKEEKISKNNENSSNNFGREKMKKRTDEPEEIVFVVKNNIVYKKKVKIGISDDSYIEITGLAENETVVSGPYSVVSKTLKEKDKVIIKNDEDSSESLSSNE